MPSGIDWVSTEMCDEGYEPNGMPYACSPALPSSLLRLDDALFNGLALSQSRHLNWGSSSRRFLEVGAAHTRGLFGLAYEFSSREHTCAAD